MSFRALTKSTALFAHKKVSALYLQQLQPLVRFLGGLSIRELVFDLLVELSRLGWIGTAVVIR
jgi:hypothetical protein